MSVLTIFTIPKPFRGHIGVIQRNAIQSWLLLRPACQVIVLADEHGTAEVAAEFNILHIPHIRHNEYGTPLVSSLFEEAEKVSAYPFLCYVNADIILMSDFLPAVRRAFEEKPRSLLVGRRWDLDVRSSIDFSNSWEEVVKDRLANQGTLHACWGMDYFVFCKGLFAEIPPFAVGRPLWDNWLVYHARSRNIPVVDLTEMATVVHQNHDYSHHPQQREGIWGGEEAERNLQLAGGITHSYTLLDAQYRLTRSGLRRKVTFHWPYRFFVMFSDRYPFLKPLVKRIRGARVILLSRS